MNILVVNPGSATLKFNVYQTNGKIFNSLIYGHISLLGENAVIKIQTPTTKIKETCKVYRHEEGIKLFMQIFQAKYPQNLDCISFRVVHGGNFTEPQEVKSTKKVVFQLAQTLTKAHADGLIKTVEFFQKYYLNTPQYFDFDTIFHQTMPEKNKLYPLPLNLSQDLNIKKFGFHGLSHQYIANRAKTLFGNNQIIISCHLGSGSSISSIVNGKSYDNSMGLTPTAGVMMSTRSGDIDPSIITYIQNELKLKPNKIDELLNKHSGLLAISSDSDCKRIEDRMHAGDPKAKLALDMLINSYVKEIGKQIFQLGNKIKPDLSNLKIIFTAGIGENSAYIRSQVISHLSFLGIKLDEKLNQNLTTNEQKISHLKSTAEVWVIPTNEELVVAQDTFNYLKNNQKI